MKALRALPVLALACAIAGPAHADTTPDAALALQTQLHDWLASLLQPAVTVPADAVKVVPEGDHFRLSVPSLASLDTTGASPAGAAFSVVARPMEAGRWAIDDLQLPKPWHFTAPAMPAEPAKDGQAQPAAEPTDVAIVVDGLQTHGVIDPSFATTSSLDQSATGLHITTALGGSNAGKMAGNTIWQPDGAGRINVTTQSTIANWQQTSTAPDGQISTLTIDHTEFAVTARKIQPASFGTLVRSFASLVPTLQPGSDTLTPDQRRLAHTIVASVADLVGSASLTETLEGLTVQSGPIQASLRRFTFGEEVAAPEGKLSLGFQVALEGLDSPLVPQGVFHTYLPKKIVLKPRLSGVPVKAVVELANRTIDTDSKDMPQMQGDWMAMLASAPINLSLEEFGFDLGPASLEGNLSFDIAGPTDISGDGDITITGLDALIKRANTTPELKQIAPVLIFLKGIGKQDGDETSFAISYENGSLKVNDTDLSGMIPAGTP